MKAVDERRRAALLPLAVAAAVVLAFLPALGNGFVDWDDDVNLTDNLAYRGLSLAHFRWMFTTIHGGNYQPLSWMTLALDYLVWGMNPAGYHLTSVLLHAANGVLVYLIVVALLRRAGVAPPRLREAAALGALVFALHPLRVESVAWVTERRDVLCGVFYLLTVLAYLRMAEAKRAGRPWRGLLLFSLATFALSLLAKAWGMTLPAVLLLLDAYPLRRSGWRALLVEKVPYAVLAFAGFLLTVRAFAPFSQTRSLAEHGVAARAAQSAYGLVFYVWKTLVPLRLSPLYLLEEQLDPTGARYVLAFAAVLAVTLALVLLRRRWPWALAAWACYATVVSPALGVAAAGPQIAADRFTYLACLPAAVLAAALLAQRRTPAVWGAALVLVGVLAALTHRQTLVWRDSLTLWNHVLALDPANHVAYTNRGWAHQLDGDRRGAVADYDRALALRPDYAPALYDRGTARQAAGDLDGAIADYTATMRVDPRDARAQANRGWARRAKGDAAGAIADYSEALAVAGPDWQHRAMVEQALAETRGAARP